jgi:hypothetical protein
MENSGNGTRTLNFHDNHIHDTSNWDTTSDAFHHNGLHNYMNVPSDSLAINFYNNLSDGNWGSCCTTATGVYTETDAPDNFNLYNNVAIQYAGNVAPAWEYEATNGVFVNNTAIGVTATPSNVEAINIYTSIGIVFENNVVTGYGQYIVVNSVVFTAFDYNEWGPIGQSGNAPWQYGSAGVNSFAAWKVACSCDAHGGNPASLGANSSGVPQSGSALIGTGINLTGFGITPLDSGTSDGDTIAPISRSSNAAWDAGAFPYLASSPPSPPTALNAVPH